MKKLIVASLLIVGGVFSVEARGDEVVRSVRLNLGGGVFDEGSFDEDMGNISGEFEVGLKRGNITNSVGIGINHYDWDDTDADPTTVEIYYSPRYTFDNNWYVSGRLGYSVGDDTDTYGGFLTTYEDEVDMTGLVLGVETGYTFDNNVSVHLGYKAVETETTVRNKSTGAKYSEDGFSHLGYLGVGYTF